MDLVKSGFPVVNCSPVHSPLYVMSHQMTDSKNSNGNVFVEKANVPFQEPLNVQMWLQK